MSNAARQSRYRARQRAGHRVFRVAVDEIALAETLISAGRVSVAASADPDRVQAALTTLIAEILAGRVRI